MNDPKPFKLDRVPVADVVEVNRLRPVYETGVQALLASIEAGRVMKDPIDVRKMKDGSMRLIDGAHRLETARRLGWTHIPVKIWSEVTDDWCKLQEIDGNLARSEMTPLDTAIFLARRKKLYEKMYPHTSAAAFKGNRHTGSLAADMMSVASFCAATAEINGMTDRHIRRFVAAGDKLDESEEDANRLRSAPKMVSLLDIQTLAKVNTPEERAYVITALVEGTAKSAAAARAAWIAQERGEKPVVKDPVEEAFNTLCKNWQRAPKAAKDRFVAEFGDDLAALLSARPTLGVAAE